MLSLNDDDDDTKAPPTGVPKDDAMKKGGWGGQNVSKSDDVILVCFLMYDSALEIQTSEFILMRLMSEFFC